MANAQNLPFVSAFALLALGALSRCGDGGPPPSYSEVQTLMNVSCTLSSCHGSARQGMLSLVASDSYCALVGSSGGATVLSTAKGQFPRRVVPGNREASFLYKKLILTPDESGPSKPLGIVMPENQAFADKANIELFGRWIDAGAKNANDQAAPGSCP